MDRLSLRTDAAVAGCGRRGRVTGRMRRARLALAHIRTGNSWNLVAELSLP
jgi:hypothetical protein